MTEMTKQNEEKKIYVLYDCDAWETYSSMNATQPIAVAFNKEELAPMLIRDLKEKAQYFSESNSALYESLVKKGVDSKEAFEEVFKAYDLGITCRHLTTLNQGYQTN